MPAATEINFDPRGEIADARGNRITENERRIKALEADQIGREARSGEQQNIRAAFLAALGPALKALAILTAGILLGKLDAVKSLIK